MKMTPRQREVLEHAAGPHGIYPHTAADRTVLENLWLKDLVIQSCNGTAKWHATQKGRAALTSQERKVTP